MICLNLTEVFISTGEEVALGGCLNDDVGCLQRMRRLYRPAVIPSVTNDQRMQYAVIKEIKYPTNYSLPRGLPLSVCNIRAQIKKIKMDGKSQHIFFISA